ncbi:MAG: DUF6259 domain-containing protein [Clostridia bacterium]|nr:DUF6259 domain-containing protein [Clostridia bacterium]
MATIQNSCMRIDVNDRTGAVTGLWNLAVGAGTPGQPTGPSCPSGNGNLVKWPCAVEDAPVRVVCLDPNHNRRVFAPGPAVAVCVTKESRPEKAEGNALLVEHDYLVEVGGSGGPQREEAGNSQPAAEVPIRCKWSVVLPGDDSCESTWRVTLDNASPDMTVVEVVFPVLRGLGVGESSADDVLIFPHHAGERIQSPAETLSSYRYMKFWRAHSIAEPEGYYSREINYCGLASMMWTDLSSTHGASGIYVGSHDPSFVLTGVRAETGGKDWPWMGLAFRKYLPVRPGAVWESAPYVVALHEGDWHWGARRYRAWALENMKLPDVPRDLQLESSVCPRYDFKNGQVVHHRYCEIPEMFQHAKDGGIDHFFISGWNRMGFDTDYPEYVPDMELGSSWELAEGCKYVREHGGFCTFYMNVRLFDEESDFFPTLGKKWAIKAADGELSRETYGPQTFAVMCPSCREYQKWIVDTGSWMVRAFGARGVYLDQLGSAEPFPCYDENHCHTSDGGYHHGLYNHGYLKMIRGISERIHEIDPSSFLMIENCGDIYSQYLYANLTWNGEAYDEFFNVYKYTFPEFLQINMVNPRRIPDRTERAAWFYRDVARAFVLGSIFWAELGDRFGEGNENLLEYAKTALRLRQQAAPFIAQGVYRDVAGIEVVPPAGEHSEACEPVPCWGTAPASCQSAKPMIPTDPAEASWAAKSGQGNTPDGEVDWNALPYSDLTSITVSRWELPRFGALMLIANTQRRRGARIIVRDLSGGRWSAGGELVLIQRELGGGHTDSRVTPEADGSCVVDVPESQLSFIVLMPNGKR